MDSDEEYPEVVSTITVSRSQPQPQEPDKEDDFDNTEPEDTRDKEVLETDRYNIDNVEIDVPFPEVQGLKHTKSSGYEESWSETAKKSGDKKSPLRVKFDNYADDQNDEDYPEDQEDPNVDDPTGQRSARGRGPITKVVIRRLPPTMTKDEFIEAVQPLPEHNFTNMLHPDKEWGFDARSVAHINFVDESDALWFMERFTGYQFIDTKGDEYVSICDAAIHPGVPKPGKLNTKRGTLEQSEHYQEFMKRYEERSLSCDEGDESDSPTETTVPIVTPEMMLAELQERTAAKKTESTPLLEFLKNKKAASRKERDMKRQRERRSSERRENSESKYRELKRERKRDRRDKERKERREKEKLEREAKTKGMTITYSKSGKVTRWSTNSSPFPKKTDDESAQSKNGKDEGEEKLSSISEDKEPTGGDTNNGKDKSPRNDKFDKFEVKKKIVNPLKSKVRPSDNKKYENFEEKARFCKPFPIKEDKKFKDDSRWDKGDHRDKPSSSKLSEKSDSNPKDTTTPTKTVSSSDGQKATIDDAKDKGKKKIVKKIIKVRRVRPKGGDDGSAESHVGNEGDASEGQGSSASSVPKRNAGSSRGSTSSSFRPNSDKANYSSKENAKPKSEVSSKSRGDDENSKTDEKFDTKKSSAAAASTDGKSTSSEPKQSSSSKDKGEDDNAKRRRARPDMQIYRPGRLRKPTGNNTDKDAKDT